MDVLILGGTGAMGYYLVYQLAQGGINCVVTSRKKRQNEQNISYMLGDAHNISFIQQLLSKKKWDAIVDFMSYSTEEFKGRYQLYLNSTNHYIYLSSARVYAETEEQINEDSPRLLDVCKDDFYISTDEYALKKARQENLLRESKSFNWTIVRPYVTFSAQRLQLSSQEKECWLYRAIHGRTIVFSKDLAEKTTTLTYGQDVARGISSLIGQEKAKGEIYNMTTSETHKWSEILQAYLDVYENIMGKRPKVMLVDNWEPYHGGNLYQVKYDRLYNRKFNNERINKYVEISTFKPTIPALAKCLSEFLKQPTFKSINWRWEAKKDKLTGEWAKMSEIQGGRQKIIYLFNRIGIDL